MFQQSTSTFAWCHTQCTLILQEESHTRGLLSIKINKYESVTTITITETLRNSTVIKTAQVWLKRLDFKLALKILIDPDTVPSGAKLVFMVRRP